MYTLLEFGIRFCNAFIFSLILLLLLCSTNSTRQLQSRTSLITKFQRQLYYNSTFSDKLWTSAALLLFDEFRREAAFVTTSSANASTPSYKSIQKINRSNRNNKNLTNSTGQTHNIKYAIDYLTLAVVVVQVIVKSSNGRRRSSGSHGKTNAGGEVHSVPNEAIGAGSKRGSVLPGRILQQKLGRHKLAIVKRSG